MSSVVYYNILISYNSNENNIIIVILDKQDI
jgi:hypothetical protein